MSSSKPREFPIAQTAVISNQNTHVSSNAALRPITPPADAGMKHLQQASIARQPENQNQGPLANEILNDVIATTNQENLSTPHSKQAPLGDKARQENRTDAEPDSRSNDQSDDSRGKSVKADTERTEINLLPVPFGKMLLLGTGESGKSTILKGIKLFEEGPYTRDEQISFSKIVYSNLLDSVRKVLEAMETWGLPLDHKDMMAHAETIFKQSAEFESMPVEVYDAISNLIRDGGFQSCLKQRELHQSNDNVDL